MEYSTWRIILELLKYIFLGRGLFLLPIPEIFIFVLSKFMNDKCETQPPKDGDADAHLPENVPDIEIMQIPYSGAPRWAKAQDGITSFLCLLLTPKSTGTVRLKSVDPCERPDCQLGFLTQEEDFVVMRKAIRLGLALGREMRKGSAGLGGVPRSVMPCGSAVHHCIGDRVSPADVTGSENAATRLAGRPLCRLPSAAHPARAARRVPALPRGFHVPGGRRFVAGRRRPLRPDEEALRSL